MLDDAVPSTPVDTGELHIVNSGDPSTASTGVVIRSRGGPSLSPVKSSDTLNACSDAFRGGGERNGRKRDPLSEGGAAGGSREPEKS